jgi:hypothetical protein
MTEYHTNLPIIFIFNHAATFHINGKMNRHNVHVWGTKNPHVTLQHERNPPEVNAFHAISKERVHSPFFFIENITMSNSHLDMLTLWLLAQLEEDSNNFIFQHDGALPHFQMTVQIHLNTHLTWRWISRAEANYAMWCKWMPISPDLTLGDFIL